MSKVGVGIGLVGVLVGLAQMVSALQMCRTSCWVDDVFRLFLPKDYEFLAGGLPTFIIGIAIFAHAIWKRPKP